MNMGLHYDSVGNISTYRDAARQQKMLFSYDSMNRLITATVNLVNKPAWWNSVINPFTETYSYTPIGNFISKAGITQYYSGTKPHAVTSLLNGASFTYDANGNMTQRIELSGTQRVTYTQAWDVDNRMVTITSSLGYTATYAYDADGARVMKRSSTDDTFYVGGYLEKDMTHNVRTTYYYFGGQRVGMRRGNEVYWLHGDHLGSASLTTNISGAVVSEMRYYPFGETRWVSGTIPTDRLFTGQRVEAVTGLYDYNARMYSPSLGRFISADTVVPRAGDPQALNRYSYTYNRPLVFIDGNGHDAGCPGGYTQWAWSTVCMGDASFTPAVYGALKVAVHLNDIIEAPANTDRGSAPTSLDMTSWLIEQMRTNASSSSANSIRTNLEQHEYADALETWVSMVRTGATWDLKVDTEKIRGVSSNIILDGMTLNHQILANVHYGFVGRAVGFGGKFLETGAGVFQVKDWIFKNPSNIGPVDNYFDDPYDNWGVRFGVFLYDALNGDPSKLSADEFAKWLQAFIQQNGAPPQPLNP